MSKRQIFQNLSDPDDIHVEEKADFEEKADDAANEAYLEMIRDQARKDQNIERRLKRRRKAHGSVFYRYITIRLQLRPLLSSTQNLLILLAGFIGVLGIWAFLVFGKPNSSGFWGDVNLHWGGTFSDNTSIICEAPVFQAFTRQRANGFATVCYALVAWFILFMWFLDEKRSSTFEARFGNLPASLIIRRCAWSALLGLSLLFLAVGTWLRHATYSNVGRQLETSGYWAVLFAFSSCSVARLVDPPRKLRTREFTTISKVISFIFIFSVTGVDIAFAIRLNSFGTEIPQVVFGILTGLALLAVLIHWRLHRLTIETEIWLLFFGLFFFIVGFLFARYDFALCVSPTSFAQPYAVWHVFASLAALFFFLYLRSDLWAKGDGADLAPSIKPLLWFKNGFLAVWDSLCWLRNSDEITEGRRSFKQSPPPSPTPSPPASPISPLHSNPATAEDQPPILASIPTTIKKTPFFPRPAQRRVLQERDVEDGEREKSPTMKRVNTIKDLWSPEKICTKRQLRIAEILCGLVITGFIVFVIYLALSGRK